MKSHGNVGGRRRGFTLIELLVVVGIITLLLAIMIPGLQMMKKRAQRTVSQAMIGSLALALETYKNECGVYPPSANDNPLTGGAYATMAGAHFLSEALMGWMGYTQAVAGGDGAGPQNPPDGQFGFRLTPGGRGKIYGPYMTPKPETYGYEKSNPMWGSNPVFFDDGKPVLYYRAVPAVMNGKTRTVTNLFAVAPKNAPLDVNFKGIFVTGDNAWQGATARSPDDPTDPKAVAFRKMLGNRDGTNLLKAGETIVGQDSFLLVSPGWDALYFTDDDVVNLP